MGRGAASWPPSHATPGCAQKSKNCGETWRCAWPGWGEGQSRGRGEAQVWARLGPWQYLEVPALQVQELGAPDVVPCEDVLILAEAEAL